MENKKSHVIFVIFLKKFRVNFFQMVRLRLELLLLRMERYLTEISFHTCSTICSFFSRGGGIFLKSQILHQRWLASTNNPIVSIGYFTLIDISSMHSIDHRKWRNMLRMSWTIRFVYISMEEIMSMNRNRH